MKLTYFSAVTVPKNVTRTRAANISVTKPGLIVFNAATVAMTGIKVGDFISLAQDDSKDGNWYFFLDKKNGFELRLASNKKSLLIQHQSLCSLVRDSFELAHTATHQFKIEHVPITLNEDKTKYWKFYFEATK